MGTRAGKKDLTDKEKEHIKSLINYCEQFRYDEEKTLLHLEDNKINISKSTLYNLKKEMRNEINHRLEDIGRHEFAYEYDLALKTLKSLEPKIWGILQDSESSGGDLARASQELRAIKLDLLGLYGKHDIVKNVVAYFEDKYGEAGRQAVEEIKKKHEQ